MRRGGEATASGGSAAADWWRRQIGGGGAASGAVSSATSSAASGTHLAEGARHKEEDALQQDHVQVRIHGHAGLRVWVVARKKRLEEVLRVAVGDEAAARHCRAPEIDR